MTHALLDTLMEVDCAASVLMRSAGSSRQREHLRDAIAAHRAMLLDNIAGQAATGAARIDADTFKGIVRHFREIGLEWPDMVAAFSEVQEGG